MTDLLLQTKLYIPATRNDLVPRPRLLARLNAGLNGRLTLISAPAGFGKTTLVREWVAREERPIAWLSLDEEDKDPNRFLTYLIAALQRIAPAIGQSVLASLQSPQPPMTQMILTMLLNEIAALPEAFIFVLDDYHVAAGQATDEALVFLLDHLPAQMYLVITTREDPDLPLARLRARSQLTELRTADLRFLPDEAAAFLNQVMGLNLAADEIAALDNRTEGWIAGLQLAAVSLQGSQDAGEFIKSFSGSHRFVLDYLIEEVLQQQPEDVQAFLLQTAVLERLNGSLCNALTGQHNGQQMLVYLEQANLFLIPLDQERRWYRYHHLFAELLRERLRQGAALSVEEVESVGAELHRRASQWYEENHLEMEAFHHAVAANDIDRATYLMEGGNLPGAMPLQFRGAMAPVLNWLKSLPTAVLDNRPSLWVAYAMSSTMMGQPISSVEEKLASAETVLHSMVPDDKTRDLIGQIAAIRAMLAIPHGQAAPMIAQSGRALAYLHPRNLPVRTVATWTSGLAYHLLGDRAAASQAFGEAIAISLASGNTMSALAALTGLGQVQESQNQLHLAAESYRRVLQLAGEPPWPAACEAYLGLARICYQWNDLDVAQEWARGGLRLAQHLETIGTPATCQVLLAHVKLVQGDVPGAAVLLEQAAQFVRLRHFAPLPEVVAAQVLVHLHQGNLTAAAYLAETHNLPLSQARVYLAQDNPAAALTVLVSWQQQVTDKDWADEQLKVLVLQALAYQAQGGNRQAVQVLREALKLAEPAGFIRLFVDEGPPLAALLKAVAKQGVAPAYVGQLQAAFGKVAGETVVEQSLIEPLTERELDVLRLLGTELSGPDIARELTISLNTMRTHTKNIYSKLGVNSRRTAVRQAEELKLL